MPSQPKLRIFAGPNGSGKTTLYNSIKSIYFSTQLFINADQLEEYFKKYNFIDLSSYSIKISNENFNHFCISNGLYKKAGFNEESWNLSVKGNIIIATDSSLLTSFNSYHFAILADLIRYELLSTRKSFSFETVFSHPSKLDLVEKRYFLTMQLLTDMIKVADETYLWDNSGSEHKYLGNIKNGFLEFQQLTIPAWINTFVLHKFNP